MEISSAHTPPVLPDRLMKGGGEPGFDEPKVYRLPSQELKSWHAKDFEQHVSGYEASSSPKKL